MSLSLKTTVDVLSKGSESFVTTWGTVVIVKKSNLCPRLLFLCIVQMRCSCEIKKKLANLLTSFKSTEHKLFLKQNNERRRGICSIFLLDSEDSCHGISNKKGVYSITSLHFFKKKFMFSGWGQNMNKGPPFPPRAFN